MDSKYTSESATLTLKHFILVLGIQVKFKRQYSGGCVIRLRSEGSIRHNKRFLNLTTEAPGSTLEARSLRHTTLFRQTENSGAIQSKTIDLGETEEIPLIYRGLSKVLVEILNS